uniref:Uncharacterized protein n=1 Tax=Dulem virus 40 TaxID=3145758 RepID=A0AAU8AUX1_9CAUD
MFHLIFSRRFIDKKTRYAASVGEDTGGFLKKHTQHHIRHD